MKELKSYTIAGIFFVLILGCLSHFFYEWSSNNFIVGLFAPVSESTWEHMKLIFFPMLLYSLVAIPNLKDRYKADDDNTQVLYLKDITATISSFTEEPVVIKA